MAKEYDEDYYNLQSEKENNENQQRECRNEIDDIEQKIERLREAYNTIDAAKESIGQIRNLNTNTPDFFCDVWKGSRAEYFFEICESGELKSSYSDYISRIDEIEDAINWEIYNLDTQKNEKYGILSGLLDAWDRVWTEIQNYVN